MSTKVYTFGRNVLFICVVDYLFAVSLHVYMYVYTSCAQTQVLLLSQFLFAAVVVLCPDEICGIEQIINVSVWWPWVPNTQYA